MLDDFADTLVREGWTMGDLPPKSVDSRMRVRWPKGQTLEPKAEVLEPGDDGYEEADNPQGELTDDYA